jgi:hypothetical protein
MFLESLAKLTLFYEECRDRQIVIHSEEFMVETKKIIDSEIEILQNDVKFLVENPGPHVFGIANKEVYIFSPEQTHGSWAMVIREANASTDSQETYTFSTVIGFLEKLIQLFKNIENVNTNASTGTENSES